MKCHRVLVSRSKLLLILYKLGAINNGLFQLVNQFDEKFPLVYETFFLLMQLTLLLTASRGKLLHLVDILGFFPPIARYPWFNSSFTF